MNCFHSLRYALVVAVLVIACGTPSDHQGPFEGSGIDAGSGGDVELDLSGINPGDMLDSSDGNTSDRASDTPTVEDRGADTTIDAGADTPDLGHDSVEPPDATDSTTDPFDVRDGPRPDRDSGRDVASDPGAEDRDIATDFQDLATDEGRDLTDVDVASDLGHDVEEDTAEPCVDLEPPFADPNELPSPPYLMWVTQDAVTVRWETSAASVGRVYWGEDARVCETTDEPGAVTDHEIRLTGLTPSTDYYYSIEVGGKPIPVQTFSTAPADDDDSPFTFVVWGDNQNRPANFSQHIPRMIAEEPAFALSVGDNVQNGTRREYREQLFQPLSPLANHVAFLTAAGNHEHYGSPGISLFEEYLSQPGDEQCFGWRYGEVFFFFINTEQDLGDGTDADTCVDRELGSTAATSATYRIALFHHPPRVDYWAGGWISYVWVRVPEALNWLEPRLVAHNVDVVFNGHNHLYLHALTDDGLTYFTTGGGGGDIDEASSWSRVGEWDEIIKQIHEHHFMSVTVDHGTMTLTAINISGEVIDTVTLVR